MTELLRRKSRSKGECGRIAALIIVMFAGYVARAQEPLPLPDPRTPNSPADGTARTVPVNPGFAMPQRSGAAEEPEDAFAIRIDAGDLLEISVFGVPDLSRVVRVSSKGVVSIPLVGPLDVRGLTNLQAEELIQLRLSSDGFVKNPNVSVFIREYATQGVSVLGEVEKPGVVSLVGPRRLYDVLSSAGGLTQRAGTQVTITRRARTEQAVTVSFLGGVADPSANVPIFPGDTVVVSKAGIVYVVGDVRKPGGFIMDNHEKLTLLQALALAEGAASTAALGRSKLIRRNNGEPQEIPVDLGKVLQGKGPDLNLQDDDILFIPHSTTKGAFRRGLEAIVQTGTGVIIYRR